MTTTTPSSTPVVIDVRSGSEPRTLRKDRWWLGPVLTVAALSAYVIYGAWVVFGNQDYYVGEFVHGVAAHRNLLSPFFSPCLTASCVAGSHPLGIWFRGWEVTPALVIFAFPMGFRLTCYYYRKAYYRAFWWSPPACAVADAHGSYRGESRLPLVLQNIHRYFLYAAAFFASVLTFDAVEAFRWPGDGWGISVGAAVLTLNAIFVWGYTLSCHACRHLCGGGLKSFAAHPVRHRLWKVVTPLNARHMQLAWVSLVALALADVYVRLVASGTISDPGLHF